MLSDKKDPKLIYAQSSDIKARTYLEYRKDMKKKAIAELEIKDWLESKLKEKFKRSDLKVEKYGGDKFLWFLRKGGITREPDFVVYVGEKKQLFIEFQYAEKEDLQFFDFKISKVSKKRGEIREPYSDRLFLYVLKPSAKYALIEPKWIAENGMIDSVPAWGSRQAYRVPKEKFEKLFKEDKTLHSIIQVIEAKNFILNFQHELINIWQNHLSKKLEKVIDEERLVKILPKTLKGFFEVCFILDHLKRIPENVKLWFIYALSYINKALKLELKEISQLTYILDFLYSKIASFEENELRELEDKVKKLLSLIDSYYDDNSGLYKSSIKESDLNETRYALFSINILEDIIQDAIYYHKAHFKPITKIYQFLKDPLKTVETLRSVGEENR
ncbi:hypothetical protein [Thermosulfurimonas sp. F29]|uniref:hypothetical protein n=1 Tax=Thermosulfurimonas sp. F29 TaxID=2867247 RepID=UPI001C82AF08|nr:hypothetical protein [Thermosulfurimonas sp. F29]MBX6422299.1 hypothetical protein [Thermosulfurimonas sp. F29]